MIRVVEIAMFVAPLCVFIGWRLLMPDSMLSPKLMAANALLLALLIGALLWLNREEAEPADATYVPAELHNGQITPPHAAP